MVEEALLLGRTAADEAVAGSCADDQVGAYWGDAGEATADEFDLGTLFATAFVQLVKQAVVRVEEDVVAEHQGGTPDR